MQTMYELWEQQSSPYQKLLFLLDGGQVRRFHNVNMRGVCLVGQHSNRVAALCLCMVPLGLLRVELLATALTHDLGESVTGDIPGPSKRIFGIRDTINATEKGILANNGMFYELSEYEQQVLKVADCLDGMLTCIAERRLGNRNVEAPYQKFMSYVRVYDLTPEQTAVTIACHQLWEESMSNAYEGYTGEVSNPREVMRDDLAKAQIKGTGVMAKDPGNEQKANDYQVAGDHYKDTAGHCPACGALIQHWDLYAKAGYLEAQVAKYVTRWREKNGLEDLDKAMHFLQKLKEVATQEVGRKSLVAKQGR